MVFFRKEEEPHPIFIYAFALMCKSRHRLLHVFFVSFVQIEK